MQKDEGGSVTLTREELYARVLDDDLRIHLNGIRR